MTAGRSTYDEAVTVTAKDGSEIPVPEEFICPLTLDIMQEPVLSREGHNYEREAIMNWVSENGTSPMTRERMMPAQLVSNRALQTRIRFFYKLHGIVRDQDEDSNNDNDAKKNDGSKFMGYVSSNMTLNSLTSSASISSRPVASTSSSSNESSVEGSVDERRRQIADLIGSAMRELEDLEF